MSDLLGPLIVLGCAFVPICIYLAFTRPILFPFGLYVIMVPFDILLGQTIAVKGVAIITAATLLFHMISTKKILAPQKSWLLWACYIALAVLSSIWSIDIVGTQLTLTMMVPLFLFFTIVALYPIERDDVKIIGALSVASSTLLSAIGLFMYTHGLRTQVMFTNGVQQPEDRLTISFDNGGTILDPNHIAASLLLPIALAICALLTSRDIRLRICATVASMTMLTTLFLTGSRGGLLALVAMLLYIAWKTRYRLQILAFSAFAGVCSLFQPTVWARFNDKALGGGSGRTDIWNTGLYALKHYWYNGAGIGAFGTAYDKELSTAYQQIFQGWSRPAHNAILSAAVELGILGALLLIFAWRSSWEDARGNLPLEAALIGLAIAAYFLDVMHFKYIWFVLTMVIMAKNAVEPKYLFGLSSVPHKSYRLKMERKLALQKPKNFINVPQKLSWREKFANKRILKKCD